MAAPAVLVIGWNRPHAGMDERAFAHLPVAMEYLRAQQGKYFERMEVIGITPHFGTFNGCFILFGERAKLDELRRTDEFESFSMNLGALFDGYGVAPGLCWEGIQQMLTRRQPKK